jgi:hypothetical protein
MKEYSILKDDLNIESLCISDKKDEIFETFSNNRLIN